MAHQFPRNSNHRCELNFLRIPVVVCDRDLNYFLIAPVFFVLVISKERSLWFKAVEPSGVDSCHVVSYTKLNLCLFILLLEEASSRFEYLRWNDGRFFQQFWASCAKVEMIVGLYISMWFPFYPLNQVKIFSLRVFHACPISETLWHATSSTRTWYHSLDFRASILRRKTECLWKISTAWDETWRRGCHG